MIRDRAPSAPGQPFVVRSIALLALAALAGGVQAQGYPARTVRIIVPFPPGGGTDIIARVLAPRLGEGLKEQVVVDNRPGGGTIIGAELAARATPDGHTLFMGITGTMAINPGLYPKLPYDPIRDFAPIAMIGVGPNILVVHPSLPVRTAKDLIALARTHPQKLAYASSGIGGAPHLAGELFKSMAGIGMVHVPYKGAGPATVDLISGQVQVMFAGMGAALPFIRQAKLRGIAVASLRRSPAAPQTPTIAETLPGFEASTWFGLFAPAAVPREIVARLHDEVVRAVNRPEVSQPLQDQGYEPWLMPPDALAAYLRSEVEKWTRVIRSAGIRPE
jgi:tripartite-type tricarboxylate transporter receptor subunit TctC